MSRRSRRHGGHEEAHANEERWLLTYADMITLLLALFIVLFAISTINQKKFLALALGLKESFDPKPGILPNHSGLLQETSLTKSAGQQMTPPYKSPITPTSPPAHQTSAAGPTTTASTIPASQLTQVEKQLEDALQKAGLKGYVSLQNTTRGVVVQILADKVFFATGSADLGPLGNQVVDTVSTVLRTDSYNVNVEGYTDNQPVTGGLYSSNEELSAVRAVNVVLRLENTDRIDPNRLSATGYGDTHPVAPNTTPQNMANNRRIDIVILSSQQSQP
ncbi:MAG TPA: flagellar motor protein MotB [Acidimicrobiales bacterium]|nr:flagellar motor protein MotB [Acidimicrobiales bacterium]